MGPADTPWIVTLLPDTEKTRLERRCPLQFALCALSPDAASLHSNPCYSLLLPTASTHPQGTLLSGGRGRRPVLPPPLAAAPLASAPITPLFFTRGSVPGSTGSAREQHVGADAAQRLGTFFVTVEGAVAEAAVRGWMARAHPLLLQQRGPFPFNSLRPLL